MYKICLKIDCFNIKIILIVNNGKIQRKDVEKMKYENRQNIMFISNCK